MRPVVKILSLGLLVQFWNPRPIFVKSKVRQVDFGVQTEYIRLASTSLRTTN